MMAAGELYEVFARKERQDPLTHVGSVRAADVELARVYARTTYDEENWVEMVVVPRGDFIHVIELEPLVSREEVDA